MPKSDAFSCQRCGAPLDPASLTQASASGHRLYTCPGCSATYLLGPGLGRGYTMSPHDPPAGDRPEYVLVDEVSQEMARLRPQTNAAPPTVVVFTGQAYLNSRLLNGTDANLFVRVATLVHRPDLRRGLLKDLRADPDVARALREGAWHVLDDPATEGEAPLPEGACLRSGPNTYWGKVRVVARSYQLYRMFVDSPWAASWGLTLKNCEVYINYTHLRGLDRTRTLVLVIGPDRHPALDSDVVNYFQDVAWLDVHPADWHAPAAHPVEFYFLSNRTSSTRRRPHDQP